MIPLALKIFLMEQNKFSQYFLILIALLLVHACQHSLIEERSVILNKIEFGSNIQNSLRQKSKKYFIQDSSSTNLSLKFVDLNFKKKKFYGGLGARAKQIEIQGELKYILGDIASSKIESLYVSGSLPVNENNPQAEIMAQKVLIQELEFLLLEELIQEYWLIES
jgi:hypothetical protein